MSFFAAIFLGFVGLCVADVSGGYSTAGRHGRAYLTFAIATNLMLAAILCAAAGTFIR